jgi:hypothetical protein
MVAQPLEPPAVKQAPGGGFCMFYQANSRALIKVKAGARIHLRNAAAIHVQELPCVPSGPKATCAASQSRIDNRLIAGCLCAAAYLVKSVFALNSRNSADARLHPGRSHDAGIPCRVASVAHLDSYIYDSIR